MATRQHDAPMIHLGTSATRRHARPFQKRPTARRTPVRQRFLCNLGMTLTANTFHTSKDYSICPDGITWWKEERLIPLGLKATTLLPGTLDICLLPSAL